jgi:hypothetical protein
LDGRILVSYRGQIITPGEAPPLAAALRDSALAPLPATVLPDEMTGAEQPVAIGEPRPRKIWYEESALKRRHQELIKAGMKRAQQRGTHIGRPRVTEQEGFLVRFAAVRRRLGEGTLSRRQAAKELDIGYATLKRLLDARLVAARRAEVEQPGETPSFATVEDRPEALTDPNRSEGARAAGATAAGMVT